MPSSSSPADPGRILLIWLQGEAADLRKALAWLCGQAPGDRLVVLTTPQYMGVCAGSAHQIWSDGAVRGGAGVLALVRRLSWAGFAAVYDPAPTIRSRLYRYLTNPRPPWHVGLLRDG